MHNVSDELHRLSLKYAALTPEKRVSFRALVSANAIDGERLPIVPIADRGAPLPLSFGQERLWFLWQLDPQRTDYNVSGAVRLVGELDAMDVRAALSSLVVRHEALRTRFSEVAGIAQQAVVPTPSFGWSIDDLRIEVDAETRLAERLRRGSLEPFDLVQGPLFRAALIRVAEREHVLLLAAHHIVCDGWSVGVLLKDFVSLYRSVRAGNVAALAELPISYADFSVWQREWLDEQAYAEKLAQLRARLGTEHPALNLATARTRNGVGGGAVVTIMLGGVLSERVQSFARSRRTTRFNTLLALWTALLSRLTAQRDVRVGIPVAGRRRLETHELVGFFVNTLVIRSELGAEASFSQWLEHVQARVLEAESHQDVPFARLVDELAPDRSAQAKLFDVTFDLEQDDAQLLGDLPGLSVSAVELESAPSKFDLSLHVTELAADFRLVFEYVPDRFDGDFVSALAQHYRELLSFCLAEPESPTLAAPLDCASEAWGAGNESDGELLTRIAEWARVRPQAIALVHEGGELSWAGLWSWSGRLARELTKLGVGRERVVALCLPRSAALVASILAVWRAGGAYLPLDPDLPAERLAFQITDAAAPVVIATEVGDWVPAAVAIVHPGTFERAEETSTANEPVNVPFAGQAAYLIYTSGSTGRPKGVAVQHAALAAYVQALVERLPTHIESAAYVSTPAADLGHTALFGALYSGWTLHVVSDAVSSDPDQFAAYMRARRVDALKIVPSHLAALLVARDAAHVLPLKCLILGGDTAEAGLVAQVSELNPSCCIINHYGPTETTVGVLTHRNEAPARQLPLGSPLSHCRVYVLDADGKPTPRGGIGEIAVGGAGVARGYLGRAGLSADRFVPDPLGRAGGRLYRTGDRGRHLANGEIEFLGRMDDQVKIRGYRVEPLEVTARIRELPGVRDAFVIARPDARGQSRLIGYCVGDGLTESGVRASLDATLPSYMVPAVIQILDALPLTTNGKVDRAALPASSEPSPTEWMVPRTARESALLAVFQRVLGREDVGISDDFFALGGESLLSLQVVARARQAGLVFTVKDLFAHPRVDRLAALAEAVVAEPEPRAEHDGLIPLTPIQARFFARNPSGPSHWNQSLLLSVGKLDPVALEVALTSLVRRHDALRLRFERSEHGFAQRVTRESSEGVLETIDLRGQLDVKARLESEGSRLQRSLRLDRGPLFRAGYFRIAEGEGRLLLVIHHLAVDGVSFGILLEELEEAYERQQKGQPLVVTPVALPWSAWALELNRHRRNVEAAEQDYWRTALDGAEGSLPVSAGGDRSIRASREFVQRWDASITRRILETAPRAYRLRIDEVLIAALAQTIAEWTGRQGALLELEGHGREHVLERFDPSRTVGWFTTRYPVWLRVADSVGSALESVKETLRSVPNRGFGWGLLAYSADEETRAQSELRPRPDVSFNYLGRLDATLRDGGRFALASESAGDSLSPESEWGHSLDLLALVSGGELSLRWRFSPEVIEPARVAWLAAAFEQKLDALVAFLATAETTPTASDFPLASITQREFLRLKLGNRELQDIYPASALQQGLLFHGSLATGAGFYVNQRRLTLDPGVNRAALRAAWEAAVARHDVLRTHFETLEDGRMLQCVRRAVALPYAEHDWSAEPDYVARLAQFRREDLELGFDPAHAPLLRVNVFTRPEGMVDLVWTYHHALLDGWSSGILLAELVRDYRSRCAGETAQLLEPIPYRRFVEWAQRQPSAELWWRKELTTLSDPGGVLDAIGAPDHAEPGTHSERVGIGLSLSEQLRAAARRHRVTLGTVTQAAWALLLARYASRRQVIFGVTVAGRPAELSGSERILGPFINSLPVWIDIPRHARLSEWLGELQRRSSELRGYEHTPLQRIQQWAGRAGRSLFDSLIVFESYPLDDALKDGTFATAEFDSFDRTHYPLVLTVIPDQPELVVEWEWDGDKLGRTAVEQLSKHFSELLEQFAADGDPQLGAIRPGAKPAVVERNSPPVGAQAPLLALERIELQMLERPDAEAIVCGTQRLTYGELRASAERVKLQLIDAGVRPDERVALCAERTPALLAACLGIWLAGCAYVPLEPESPAARLQAILSSAEIRFVVADAVSLEQAGAAFEACAVVRLDGTSNTPSKSRRTRVHPDQLAYVLYTSGSTGEAKGVAVSHRALGSHVEDCLRVYELSARDRVYQFSTIHFDASAEQIFPALAVGACVVMRGNDVPEWSELERALRAQAVTVIDLPTSYWQQGVDQVRGSLPRLRLMTLGGEVVSPSALGRWKAGALGSLRLFNTYGPTEAAIACIVHETTLEDAKRPSVPIGQPLPSRALYLLDDEGEEVPSFGVGEICIGGNGIARGYLARASATAASFVPDPNGSGGRLYRTGDRARRDQRGVVSFLGRTDNQVKIRGYRVELGEVERALASCPGVRHAAATVHHTGGASWLAAYVAGSVDSAEVRQHLERSLPAYALPASIDVLEALPLSVNGKVDRRALPEPSLPANRVQVEPETAIERRLLAIWRVVLGRSELATTDHFFEVGGDSISTLQIVARARAHGIQITPKQVFEHPTVTRLARVAVVDAPTQAESELYHELPLTPIQSWFFARNPAGEAHYNQSVLLRVNGELDQAALGRAVVALVARHDALRLRFVRGQNGWAQRLDRGGVNLGLQSPVDLRAQSDWAVRLEVEAHRLQRSLDLVQGPLFRVAYFRIGEDDGRLLLLAHHLVVDAVSWRIVLHDLAAAYQQAARGEPVTFAPSVTPWTAWVAAAHAHADSSAVREELKFWQGALASAHDSLPEAVTERSVATKETSDEISLRLDATTTKRLATAALRAYRMDIGEVLLTALARTLSASGGGVLVDVEGHGREDFGAGRDVSETVGWFTIEFPIWLSVAAADGEALRSVKEQLRSVPRKGAHAGWLRYGRDESIRAQMRALPEARVGFNYLGRFDGTLPVGGLFSFARESVGEQAAPSVRAAHALEVSALVESGELSVRFQILPDVVASEIAWGWLRRFELELHALIEHCDAAAPRATASDFVLAALSPRQLEAIDTTNVVDIYPATPAQQGLLFHTLHDGTRGLYVDQIRFTITAPVDFARLRAAWNAAIARHDILRTRFEWRHGGEPLQVVQRDAILPFIEEDATSVADYESHLSARLADDLAQGVALDQAPLMRVRVVQRPDGAQDLVWTSHHVLLDGWSTSRLLGEILESYRLPGGANARAQIPFRHYVAWLREQPSAEAWWRVKLAATRDPARLLSSLRAAPVSSAANGKLVQDLTPELDAQLRRCARSFRVTLSTVVQAAWALVLGCYGNRDQAVFGVTVAGRPPELSGIEEMLGLFMHSLPLWVDLPAEARVGAWLDSLQRANLELRQREHTPLADIQRWSGLTGDALFDTLLVFENYPVHAALNNGANLLGVANVEKIDRTHFPLTLTVRPDPSVQFEWEWDEARVEPTTARALADQFIGALEQLTATSDETRLGELSLRGSARYSTSARYRYRSLLSQIEAQCIERAEQPAVWCEGEVLSYGDLGAWSSVVSLELERAGVRREQLVGLCVSRGLSLVASVLGTWKSGGALVPLDPTYPEARLRQMLRGVAVVLADSETAMKLREVLSGVRVVEVGAQPARSPEHPLFASRIESHAEQLAYVIYTSGSTGEPKGVGVSQGSLSAHVDDFLARYGIGASDCQLFSSTINFDVWLHELLPALTQGGRVLMRGQGAWEFSTLTERLREQRVTFARVSTAYWTQWAKWLRHEGRGAALPTELRQVTVGGEGLSGEALKDWFSGPLSSVSLDNLYGPTETTVAALYHRTSEADVHEAVVPIGAPFAGRTVFVIDSWGREVPVGGIGELCIGGVTVARGYLGRPSATAERFVPDPHTVGGRLYRSGDLSRLRADGTVEFLGRSDEQIKLRGYRIELGEVESALLACGGVSAAVAAVRGDGEHRRLVGYVTGAVDLEALKIEAASKLPGYMIPTAYVLLEALPLLANGKVDRRSLPEPVSSAREQRLAPRTPAETTLYEVWCHVLKRAEIGVRDNYFELGGDSILSLQIIALARQRGLKLTPKQLFEQPTIEALARVATAIVVERVTQESVLGDLPLTPIQARFFELHPDAPAHWNQSVLLAVRGELSQEALKRTLEVLVSRHDALRLRFSQRDGLWTQRVASDVERQEVELVDLSRTQVWEEALEIEGERVQRSLDLARGPLLRACYFRLPGGESRLLLVVHHLAVDGVSWRVLLDEISQAYQQAERALPIELPPSSSPFSLWAARLSSYATRSDVRSEIAWWRGALSSPSELLTPFVQQGGLLRASQQLSWELDPIETRQLLEAAPRSYRMRIDEVLLTALVQTWAEWTGRSRVLVDLEGHGREEILDELDVSRTVGWFTSRFPVWLAAHGDAEHALIDIKERLRAVPNKGVHWGLFRHSTDRSLRSEMSEFARPEVSFNYLGQFDQAMATEGRFGFAREAAGSEVDPDGTMAHALAVNGLIAEGALSVSFRFNAALAARLDPQRVVEAFGRKLRTLLAHSLTAPRGATASDFPLARLTQSTLSSLGLRLGQVQDIYPATPIQQGLVFHSLERSGEGLYVYQLRLVLSGKLDPVALREAWQEIVARYDVLRTHFAWQHGGEVLQIVRRQVVLPFVFRDWHGLVDYDQRFEAFRREDIAIGFDLADPPLLRVHVIARPDGAHDLVWTMHHAISDGWSSARIVDEVIASYRARIAGEQAESRPVVPYRNYIEWLVSRPSVEQWWKAALASLVDPARLLSSLGRPCAPEPGTHHRHDQLAPELGQRVQELAKRCEVTISTVMQAAWGVVLGRYGNRQQAMFGATVSGRPAEVPGALEMIGLFINAVPIPVDLPLDEPVSRWLRKLQHFANELRLREQTPLSDLQRWSGLQGDAFFDTLLVFENFPVDLQARSVDVGLRIERSERADRTHYPLTLTIEVSSRIELEWEWDGQRVDRERVAWLSQHYLEVLEQFVARPDAPLGAVKLTAPELWSRSKTHPYRSVFSRIEAQCLARRLAPAVWCEGEVLSYGELGAWSSVVGLELERAGVGREQLVGLCVNRGLSLVASVLGIWKSGGALVPLDPTYPEARLRQMLCGVAVVLADAETATKLREVLSGVRVVVVAQPARSPEVPLCASRFEPHAEQLAYVIYTSGSTGEPKGVGVSQGSLSAHVDDFLARYGVGPSDCQLFSSTINFDVWLHELLPALTQGGRVLMRGQGAWEFSTLTERLREQRVTFARVSTAYWTQWAKWLRHEGRGAALPTELRQVTVGGEGLSGEALKDWFSGPLSSVKLDNLYGPTETTVAALYHRTSEADVHEAVVPIGAPFAGRTAFVIDSWGREVPVGGIGELCIGGVTVARGYLGRPSATAERFVPDPHTVGGRLYRSGDLSRLRAAGTVEFLGRSDEQIKLRGYRIELGEVESALLACGGVSAAVAAVRGDGEHRRLVGYVTGAVDLEALKVEAASKLPGYMVPTAYVLLEALPLLANGKVDRRSLPEPPSSPREQRLAPRTAVETTLYEVWCQVLKRAEIGVRDNYFELGGDSILSLQILALARQRGLRLTPKQLFEQPTIEALARVATAMVVERVTQESVLGDLPLTPIQARFFDLHPDAPAHWNQSVLLAARDELSLDAVERTLDVLVARHDALRLRFSQRDGLWTQRVAHEVERQQVELVELSQIQAWEEALAVEGERVQRSLDLARGPLLRACYFRLPDGEGRLLLVVHHLAVDGVSWRVLLDELSLVYQQAERALPIELPPGSSPFSLWAAQLSRYAARDQLDERLRWWERTMSGIDAAWPSFTEGNRRADASRAARWTLDRASTELLLQHAARVYRMRIDEVLLTALAQVLSEWTGRPGVLVDLEGHGREDVLEDMDLSRTVGWFTSRFPVWLAPAVGIQPALIDVKERLRSVPNKGLDWGLASYLAAPEVRACARALPRAWVSFNYLGRFDEVLASGGRFGFAGEAAGESVDPKLDLGYPLELNGMIADGVLSMSFRYSPDLIAPEVVDALVANFDAQVRAQLEHCMASDVVPTASDFGLADLSQPELAALNLPLAEVQDIYPATPIQQGLIFQGLLEPERGAYVNQLRLTLRGTLDRAALRGAWETIVARHDILRTHFEWRHGGQALQVVHRSVVLPYAEYDWSEEGDYETRLAAWQRADIRRGFELDRAPLLRVALFARPDGGHDLLRSNHHALTDGWSSEQLFAELLEEYDAQRQGLKRDLPPALPYRDYIAWLRARPSARPFWQARLRGMDEPATALASLVRPKPSLEAAVPLEQHLGPDLSQKLRETARAHQITLSTLTQAAWSIVLGRLCNRQQAIFGVTLSGRPSDLPGVDRMVGPFINSLPVLTDLPPQISLRAWLTELQRAASELGQYEYTPLNQLQQWVGRPSVALFDSLIVFENYPTDDELLSRDIGLTMEHSELVDRTHYPLVLIIVPEDEQIRVEWEWDPGQFEHSDIERFARSYLGVLEQLCTEEDRLLGSVRLPPSPPSPPALVRPYRSLHQRLAEQAAACPDAVAVLCEGERLTRRELVTWANRLSAHLVRKGVAPDERVGISVERSTALVSAVLGVLGAGAAYVPLDPAYPEQRLRAIISDARIGRVVADRASFARLSAIFEGCEVTFVDSLPELTSAACVEPHPEQTAYVIYTSGSTGEPKGVSLSRGALSVHIDDYVSTYGLDASDRVYQFSTINFDASAEQLFPALSVGACVVMRGPALPDLASFNATLREQSISVVDLPTGYWLRWVDELPRPGLPSLRLVTVGGEALPTASLLRWKASPVGHVRLDNSYGPTEAAIAACFRETTAGDAGSATVPIGQPYPGREAHVLDLGGEQVAPFALGELCIGGPSLARGYERRPSLTAERFVPDPYGSPGTRLYRTGDLVRRRADGVLEFWGRRDGQIKLRGHRIELQEVEDALRRASGRSDVAATVQGTSENRRIVGYVVGEIDVDALHAELARRLPGYMMPSVIVGIAALPLSANGKVDRGALPEPKNGQRTAVLPQTELEQRLFEIWSLVLDRRDFGVTDDFFALGGDSLSALRVAAAAQRAGVNGLSLEALFAARTVSALAELVAQGQGRPAGVVRLGPPSSGRNLFCVHPLYGTVGAYAPLAAALADVATVYGLQSPIYSERAWRADTLDALARDYLARMRRVQTQGPYYILGWSLGGWIAAAIARQLELLGERVAFVGIVDTSAEIPRARVDRTEIANDLAGAAAEARRTSREELELEVRQAHATRNKAPSGAADALSGDEGELLETVLDVIVHHEELLASHRITRVESELHVWRAIDARTRPEGESGWANWCERAHVVDIDASHEQIIGDPRLAADLRRLLSELDWSNS
ncbi:MAG: non-ribosomal peptide synthase/polyketide synthase [Pseudomonadota bacterium]